jgi:hypothetical protein
VPLRRQRNIPIVKRANAEYAKEQNSLLALPCGNCVHRQASTKNHPAKSVWRFSGQPDLRQLVAMFPGLGTRFYRSLAVILAQRLRQTSRELLREMTKK